MNQSHTLGESDLEAIKRDGIVKKDRFFSAGMIDQIAETTIRLRHHALPHRKPARKWILVSPLNALARNIRSETRAGLSDLSGIALQCGFKEFSSLYLEGPAWLSHIMSIEYPASDEPITPWHTDDNSPSEANIYPPNFFTLKFFIYLNDVDSTNGAFAYVRGSHRLVVAIRESIYRRRIPFCKTRDIADIRAACENPQVAHAILKTVSRQDIDDFMSATEDLSDESESPELDLIGPAGTLLVFDDRGMHRGGIPRGGHRSILRYNYVLREYWGMDLSRTRYMLNMAARALLPRIMSAHW